MVPGTTARDGTIATTTGNAGPDRRPGTVIGRNGRTGVAERAPAAAPARDGPVAGRPIGPTAPVPGRRHRAMERDMRVPDGTAPDGLARGATTVGETARVTVIAHGTRTPATGATAPAAVRSAVRVPTAPGARPTGDRQAVIGSRVGPPGTATAGRAPGVGPTGGAATATAALATPPAVLIAGTPAARAVPIVVTPGAAGAPVPGPARGLMAPPAAIPVGPVHLIMGTPPGPAIRANALMVARPVPVRSGAGDPIPILATPAGCPAGATAAAHRRRSVVAAGMIVPATTPRATDATTARRPVATAAHHRTTAVPASAARTTAAPASSAVASGRTRSSGAPPIGPAARVPLNGMRPGAPPIGPARVPLNAATPGAPAADPTGAGPTAAGAGRVDPPRACRSRPSRSRR